MPATSPDSISNRVRLTNEVAGSVCAFVSEYGAVDAALPGGVNEPSPHKHCIACLCAEDKFFSWPDEQSSASAVCVHVGGIVPLIQRETVSIAVFGEPPRRVIHSPLSCVSAHPLFLSLASRHSFMSPNFGSVSSGGSTVRPLCVAVSMADTLLRLSISSAIWR